MPNTSPGLRKRAEGEPLVTIHPRYPRLVIEMIWTVVFLRLAWDMPYRPWTDAEIFRNPAGALTWIAVVAIGIVFLASNVAWIVGRFPSLVGTSKGVRVRFPIWRERWLAWDDVLELEAKLIQHTRGPTIRWLSIRARLGVRPRALVIMQNRLDVRVDELVYRLKREAGAPGGFEALPPAPPTALERGWRTGTELLAVLLGCTLLFLQFVF